MCFSGKYPDISESRQTRSENEIKRTHYKGNVSLSTETPHDSNSRNQEPPYPAIKVKTVQDILKLNRVIEFQRIDIGTFVIS